MKTRRLRVVSDYENLQIAYRLRGDMITRLTQRIGSLMQEHARVLDRNADLRDQVKTLSAGGNKR